MLLSFAQPLTMTDAAALPEAREGRISEEVRAAQAGDMRAFEAIYRANVGRIYALSLRLLGDRVEAETMTQDVFTHAWDRLASYRGESALSTWLQRVCVSLVLMRHRATARRLRRVETVEDLERLDPVGVSRRPEDKVDLERAIAALPEGARIVFVLYEIEGYSHAEIAERLGVAENTCKAQLHRAKRLLREVLDERA